MPPSKFAPPASKVTKFGQGNLTVPPNRAIPPRAGQIHPKTNQLTQQTDSIDESKVLIDVIAPFESYEVSQKKDDYDGLGDENKLGFDSLTSAIDKPEAIIQTSESNSKANKGMPTRNKLELNIQAASGS